MIVRDMLVSDCDKVAHIHVRAWQKTYQGIMPQDFLDSMDPLQRVAGWKASLERNPHLIRLVSVVNQEVTGFALGLENRTPQLVPEAQGEIWAIYVDPSSWGQGAGSALLKTFRERMQTSLCIWVARDNQIGHSFYKKSGGQLLPVTKNEEVAGAQIPHQVYFYP